MDRLATYRGSGRTTSRFVALGVVAVGLAVVVAWPYQAALRLVPSIVVNVLIYGAAVLGVWALVPWLIHVGHNRSRVAGVVAGLAITGGFIASSHYASYRARVREVSQGGASATGREASAARREAAAARSFTRSVEQRVETGWSEGGAGGPRVNGAAVWIVWVVEALGLLGLAAWLGAERRPYCEGCGRWMEEVSLFESPSPSRQTVAMIAGARDPAALWAPLPDADVTAPRSSLSYRAHRCAACAGPWFVTIEHQWRRARGGDVAERTQTRLQHLVEVPSEVASQHVDEFIAHARQRGVRVPRP